MCNNLFLTTIKCKINCYNVTKFVYIFVRLCDEPNKNSNTRYGSILNKIEQAISVRAYTGKWKE